MQLRIGERELEGDKMRQSFLPFLVLLVLLVLLMAHTKGLIVNPESNEMLVGLTDMMR